MKFSSKSLTNVGLVRSANEDNLGAAKTPNGDLFVVCDGMGGHVGGAQASSIAVNSIIEYFQREVYDNVIQALDHALLFSNEQIYASALNNPELKGMGTTAVLLLIRNEECFIAHVGDSRIYLRSNGKLNRLTKDHSFVQTLVDSGVINDEDAENHPNKNQILQALGIAPSVKATISQSPILPKVGDMFLLCSDGLNGMVNDRDIERILQEDNISTTAENLISAALNAGGHDNITASLVLIEESVHSSSRFVHFNPKPKVIDMTSTQQISEGKISNSRSKSKKPYYLAGIILFLGAFITWMFLRMEKSEVVVEPNKLLTSAELESYVCGSLDEIKENMKVAVATDTIINMQCKGKKHFFIVKDSIVVKVYTENNTIIITNKDVNSDAPGEQPAPKKLKDMSKNEISSLNVGSTVIEENGDFEAHGYIIKVVNKKVKSKEKIAHPDQSSTKNHVVKDQETLSKIVNLYKDYSPGLTVESLKDYNVDNNNKLTSNQKQNLSQDKISTGMELQIPKLAP
jgi:serine/threonine protein phosphatase PrpC